MFLHKEAFFLAALTLACSGEPHLQTRTSTLLGGTPVDGADPVATRMVELVLSNYGQSQVVSKCSASLLDGRYVLTQASCIVNGTLVFKVHPLFTTQLKITSAAGVEYRSIQPSDIILHPDYNPQDPNGPANDIAVVKYPGGMPVGFLPVALLDDPAQGAIVGARVDVAGFGPTSVGGADDGVLRKYAGTVDSVSASPARFWVRSLAPTGTLCGGEDGGAAVFYRGVTQPVQLGLGYQGFCDPSQNLQFIAIATDLRPYLTWLSHPYVYTYVNGQPQPSYLDPANLTTVSYYEVVGTGDPIGNHRTDLIRFSHLNGQWQVLANNGAGFVQTPFGSWALAAAWENLNVGDFNGDGLLDVVGRDASTGVFWVGLSNGSGFQAVNFGTWSLASPYADVLVGDFNGDGRADIVGRETNGYLWVALSTGGSFTTVLWGAWAPSVPWSEVRVLDVNGDGRMDLVGREAPSGRLWVARSTGGAFVNELWGAWPSTTVLQDVLVGDFNGDGRQDLVARMDTGLIYVAQSNGTAFNVVLWGGWSNNISWQDVRAGDFNGDGRTDLVGREGDNGNLWVALSNGGAFANSLWGQWATVPWQDVRVGDFNGDGKADFVGRAGSAWWLAASTGGTFVNQAYGN